MAHVKVPIRNWEQGCLWRDWNWKL